MVFNGHGFFLLLFVLIWLLDEKASLALLEAARSYTIYLSWSEPSV